MEADYFCSFDVDTSDNDYDDNNTKVFDGEEEENYDDDDDYTFSAEKQYLEDLKACMEKESKSNNSNTNNKKRKLNVTSTDHEEADDNREEVTEYAINDKHYNQQQKNRKPKKNKKCNPVKEFYSMFLSWNIDSLYSRSLLSLGPLVSIQNNQYKSITHFYNEMIDIALEECRASTYQSIQYGSRDGIVLRLQCLQVCWDNNPLITVEFNLLNQVQEMMKPGMVFALHHEHRIKPCILATIAHNSKGKSDRNNIQLWIHENHANRGLEFIENTRWIATDVGSVITQQRIVSTALNKPHPKFMSKLLVSKSSSHIKFIESGDGETTHLQVVAKTGDGYIPQNRDSLLNTSQWNAFVQCTQMNNKQNSKGGGGEIFIVQGPPGTGKTVFASETLHELIRQGRRVLVCAPSNKALSVLLERYILRMDRTVPSVLVGVENKLANTTTSASENGLNLQQIKGTESNFLNPRSSSDIYIYTYMERLSQYLSSLINTIARRQGTDKIRSSLVELCAKLVNEVPCGFRKVKKRFELVLELLKDIEYDVASVKDKLLDIAVVLGGEDWSREVIENARIVFCTLSSAGCSIMKQQTFDVLVVDEAAQCLEAELIIPFGTEPRHLILIGDPFQLPATTISQELKHLDKDQSTMARLIQNQYKYHILEMQYRMHPEISIFPNNTFYNGVLVDSHSILDRSCEFHIPAWLQHYAFIHFSGKETNNLKNISNQMEAQYVIDVVSYLNREAKGNAHICIITFYAAQVTYLKRILFSMRLLQNVVVSTVDGFQGSEADIIVLSTVRCGSAVGFLKDFQRLNVSLTRAKHLLVIVGCSQTLASSRVSILNDLVIDARKRRRLLDSADLHSVIPPSSTRRLSQGGAGR